MLNNLKRNNMLIAQELEKLEFIKANLGKNFIYDDDEWMVVGFCIDEFERVFVLASSTDECAGWSESVLDWRDEVLVHSPLNQSFVYIAVCELKEGIEEYGKRN